MESRQVLRRRSFTQPVQFILPIPIVVNSFTQFYKNRLWRNEVEHKKKERIKQIAAEKRTAQKFFLIQVGWLGLETVMLAGDGERGGGDHAEGPLFYWY